MLGVALRRRRVVVALEEMGNGLHGEYPGLCNEKKKMNWTGLSRTHGCPIGRTLHDHSRDFFANIVFFSNASCRMALL